MSKIRYTFGLDFGTSKTAISFAQADTISPQVTDVAIHGDDDRIPTCVLHDKSRNRFHVGDIAEQEYLLVRDEAERAAMAFYANFKPHIQRSAEHRETARRFSPRSALPTDSTRRSLLPTRRWSWRRAARWRGYPAAARKRCSRSSRRRAFPRLSRSLNRSAPPSTFSARIYARRTSIATSWCS